VEEVGERGYKNKCTTDKTCLEGNLEGRNRAVIDTSPTLGGEDSQWQSFSIKSWLDYMRRESKVWVSGGEVETFMQRRKPKVSKQSEAWQM